MSQRHEPGSRHVDGNRARDAPSPRGNGRTNGRSGTTVGCHRTRIGEPIKSSDAPTTRRGPHTECNASRTDEPQGQPDRKSHGNSSRRREARSHAGAKDEDPSAAGGKHLSSAGADNQRADRRKRDRSDRVRGEDVVLVAVGSCQYGPRPEPDEEHSGPAVHDAKRGRWVHRDNDPGDRRARRTRAMDGSNP